MVSKGFSQQTNQELRIGTYGAYMDYSTFTELTINSDNTFQYYDQNKLGSIFKYTGKWEIKRNKLILFDCKNNTFIPMPTKWKIKGAELISEKISNSRTNKKRRIELSYKM